MYKIHDEVRISIQAMFYCYHMIHNVFVFHAHFSTYALTWHAVSSFKNRFRNHSAFDDANQCQFSRLKE